MCDQQNKIDNGKKLSWTWKIVKITCPKGLDQAFPQKDHDHIWSVDR